MHGWLVGAVPGSLPPDDAPEDPPDGPPFPCTVEVHAGPKTAATMKASVPTAMLRDDGIMYPDWDATAAPPARDGRLPFSIRAVGLVCRRSSMA
ncbi:MAG: hypothetical protein QOI41_1309 [Myxococcales bacterium]|nr:hypothetical protein [Myxococcales bacterium]